MSNSSLLSLYPRKEKRLLYWYHLLRRLQQKIPKALRRSHDLARDLQRLNLPLRIHKGQLCFTFPLNATDIGLELDLYASDAGVFRQVFLQREYHALVERCEKLNLRPQRMVDAGANIGLASLYLKAYFPALEVLALEPNPRNLQAFQRHIAINATQSVSLIGKGLWSKESRLCADRHFRGGQDASFRLREAEANETADFETLDLNQLIGSHSWEEIDLVKIDIEGAETEVFGSEANLDWLAKTRLLALEIHDEFDCREPIENLLEEKGFQLDHRGELTLAWR